MQMNLDTITSVFTIIGGFAGLIGTIISAIALKKSSKAKKSANEALNKVEQYTIFGNNNNNIEVKNQKNKENSHVINGHNNIMR